MKKTPYGEIDRQASPTNVSPVYHETGGAKANRAMGDIDAASSPSSQNSPEDPGRPIPKLDDANYGGINSIVEIPMSAQVPGSTVSIDNASFNDDVAQYRKGGLPARPHLEELNRIRNQAYNMVDATQDNTKPPFTGRQDSDPLGG